MMKDEKETSWAILDPDIHGQQTAKIASNVCFALFVITVVIFTVIAVTYQAPDPWLQSSKSFEKLLAIGENTTLELDESVIITAEDTPLLSPVSLPPAINRSVVDEEVAAAQDNSVTCETHGPINCSDPGVLLALEKYNLQLFRSLDFYFYRSPVRGSADNECDVAWTYRSSKDGSTRLFRDFRRYTLTVLDTCNFHVERVGDWHSGENARARLMPIPVTQGIAPVSVDMRAEVGVDEINDGVLHLTENSFRRGKYLYYERGGDYCKSMSQYMWSLLCALGEARYLNRTFVMDLQICLPSSNKTDDEKRRDFRLYYDYEHLRESISIIDQNQFLKDWYIWNAEHQNQKIAVREVDYKTTPMELTDDRVTVLKRVFKHPEPNNYWFRVCDGETGNVIQRPWDVVWKSRRINDIVLAICGKMGWEYDAVHVVRGEKVENKALWPNLGRDTSPGSLVWKLEERINEGRNVYIATNEHGEGYFDKLRGKWKIFLLDDFKDLWDEKSEWYKETTEFNGGRPVDFDDYMRVEVDSEVLYKAKIRIETFNDLTKDCKNGLGAC